MIYISKPVIGKKEISAVIDVLKRGTLAQDALVKTLEANWCATSQSSYAVAVNSGTAALHAALHAIGIMPGDEVITSPFTFIASANAIRMAGGVPIFADIDVHSYNIDPTQIEKYITEKTKAIMPINIYGQPADYDAINAIAKKYKLSVVEDAAQSVGATYKGKQSGTLGDIGCFSLYATKNIMCGEGGIITMNSSKLETRARLFRQHGMEEGKRYVYHGLGYNYRLTELQAAIAIEQLKQLKNLTKKRQKIAEKYTNAFSKIEGIVPPVVTKGSTHVYHQYTIRITGAFPLSRDGFIEYLKKKGIQANVYYPIPLFEFNHLKSSNINARNYPITNQVVKEVVSIPVHPTLTLSEVNYIIKTINSCSKL